MRLPKMPGLGRAFASRIAAVAIVALVAASALHTLWSLLGGAYAADDIWNSQLPAQLHASHQGLLSFINAETRSWMHSAGRFFPTSIAEGSVVFSVLQTRFSYKIFMMASVMVDVILAFAFVAKLTRQYWTGTLVALLIAAEFEFRFFYDGIQEFGAQQEVMLAFVLIAAIATLKYIDSGRRGWLLLIVLSWAAALTTYETSFVLIGLLWIVIWHRHPIRRRLFTSLVASGVPTALIGGYVLYLRLSINVATPSQYTASLSPAKVLPTFAKQLAGTVPFSEYYFAHSPDLVGALKAPQYSVFGIFLLVAVAGIISLALYRQSLNRRDRCALLLSGIVLLAGPAVLIAITETWQSILTWGVAYISVYVEGFGLVLVLVALIDWAVVWVKSFGRRELRILVLSGLIVAVSITSSFVILAVAGENVRVIQVNDPSLGWMNQQSFLGWNREIATDAAEAGLYGHHHGNELVAAITGAPWINSAEVSYESGTQVSVVNAYPYWTLNPQLSTQVPGCPLAPARCTSSAKYQSLVYVGALGFTTGYAVLGQFSSATSWSSSPDDVTAVVKDPTIFIEDPSISRTSKVSLCRLNRDSSLHRIRNIRTVGAGDNWRIMQGNERYRVAVASIGLDLGGRCTQL